MQPAFTMSFDMHSNLSNIKTVNGMDSFITKSPSSSPIIPLSHLGGSSSSFSTLPADPFGRVHITPFLLHSFRSPCTARGFIPTLKRRRRLERKGSRLGGRVKNPCLRSSTLGHSSESTNDEVADSQS